MLMIVLFNLIETRQLSQKQVLLFGYILKTGLFNICQQRPSFKHLYFRLRSTYSDSDSLAFALFEEISFHIR